MIRAVSNWVKAGAQVRSATGGRRPASGGFL
jgi:hypothetical protein